MKTTTSSIFGRLALHGTGDINHNSSIPAFLYGTAWKKEKTADLVYLAVTSGFRGVDTANQPKHYRENLVGEGIRRAIKEGVLRRSELFLQTKFTSIHGQDPERVPYDHQLSITQQVQASVESSLRNLSPAESDVDKSYIDSLVLHSPMPTLEETLEAWRAMETFVPHQVHNLGISNCNLFILMELCSRVTIKPAIVQNRFYASTKYDIGLREFCETNHIIYQSFWTLTANPNLLRSTEAVRLGQELHVSPQSALYCLVLGLGNVVVLNGTQTEEHMVGDLAAIEKAASYASLHPKEWAIAMEKFKKLIGQPLDL